MLPLTYIWLPFLKGNYGLAVAWCWIRAINENCEVVGTTDQVVVGYIMYMIVGLVGIVTMIGITVTYCRLSTEFTHARKLLLQSLVLMSFVLLYVLFICAAVAVRIYTSITKQTQHYAIQGVNMPLCFLISPFGSFYFSYFRNKCCKKYARRDHYDRLEAAHVTFPISTRKTAPSSTYYNVSYTNGFLP